jgi:hypothetical protein
MARTARSLGIIAVISVAAFSGLSGTASAASAADGNVCEGGEFCLWEDYGKGGSERQFTGDIADYRNWNWYRTPDGMDNEASSAWNRAGCQVTLWQDVGQSGARALFNPNGYEANLNHRDLDDNSASSHDVHCR